MVLSKATCQGGMTENVALNLKKISIAKETYHLMNRDITII